MKLKKNRLKEIIKEELFYREFYRAPESQNFVNEEEGALGLNPKVQKAVDLLAPLNLEKEEIDELVVHLSAQHSEAP